VKRLIEVHGKLFPGGRIRAHLGGLHRVVCTARIAAWFIQLGSRIIERFKKRPIGTKVHLRARNRRAGKRDRPKLGLSEYDQEWPRDDLGRLPPPDSRGGATTSPGG